MAQKPADRLIHQMPWLDPPAEALQHRLKEAVTAGGPTAQAAKDALHGRWLGHPLHPALVSLPLGAWTATLILDLAGLDDGADLTLALGLAGATSAALAGVADWSETSGEERRMGLLHALLNTGGVVLNVASLVLRRRGQRTRGVALSTLAYAIGGLSSFLGGELVYAKGVSVNHSAWDSVPDDFTPALEAAKLREGAPVRGEVNGVPIVLVKQGTEIFALDAVCTHAGGPLDQGRVDGDTIVCPWHGSAFCLRDGRTRRGPATVPAQRLIARVRDGQVEVRRAD